MSKQLNTKFGTAKVNNNGRYAITSVKEGNHNKYLHRLIFEDYYKITLLKTTHIHHINGNKLDNRIENLQMLTQTEHAILHNKNKVLSEETKQKISEANKGKKLSSETKKKLSESRKGKNNPLWNKHHSKETRKKMSKALKGMNNPRAKYSLWDISKITYDKRRTKCFSLKYNAKYVSCGGFIDHITPEIIYNLINEYKGE